MRAFLCSAFLMLAQVNLFSADTADWSLVLQDVSRTCDVGKAQAWLEGRTPAEYAACWKQLTSDTLQGLPRAIYGCLIECLFTRWAAADAPGSLRVLISDVGINWQDADTVKRAWAQGAWTRTEVMIEALRDANLNEASLRELLPSLAEQLPGPDVAAAYGQLKKLGEIAPVREILRETVGAAALRCAELPSTMSEWQAARSFVAKLSPSEFRNSLTENLWLNPPADSSTDSLWQTAQTEAAHPRIKGWLLTREFRHDRDGAWSRLLSVPQHDLSAVEEAFIASASGASQNAASWFLAKKPVSEWSPRGLSVMVRYYLEIQRDAAVNWMRQNAASLSYEVWSYAGQFAMDDPDFARFWLQVRCGTPEQAKKSGHSNALQSLGKEAPDEAVNWINSHLIHADRDLALVAQIRLWGGQMPDKALAVLRTIQSPDWFADGRSALFETWAPRDFAAALQAAKDFPDEDRLRAVSNACEKAAKSRAEEAAEAFVELLKETQASEKHDLILGFAADDVIEALFSARGLAVLDWLRQTVPPTHRAAMARRAFHRVGRQHRGDLDTLIASLPEDDIKEVWRQEAASYSYDTPWQAFPMAVQIRDPKVRREVCRNLAHAWRSLDVVFAREELPKIQLPESEKSELLTILSQP
jgi:hypothetical protein